MANNSEYYRKLDQENSDNVQYNLLDKHGASTAPLFVMGDYIFDSPKTLDEKTYHPTLDDNFPGPIFSKNNNRENIDDFYYRLKKEGLPFNEIKNEMLKKFGHNDVVKWNKNLIERNKKREQEKQKAMELFGLKQKEAYEKNYSRKNAALNYDYPSLSNQQVRHIKTMTKGGLYKAIQRYEVSGENPELLKLMKEEYNKKNF